MTHKIKQAIANILNFIFTKFPKARIEKINVKFISNCFPTKTLVMEQNKKASVQQTISATHSEMARTTFI